MNKHNIKEWETKHEKWLITAEIISATSITVTMLIAIATLFAENPNTGIFIKALAVLGTITIALIILTLLNYSTETIYTKIAIHQTQKKENQTILKWVEEYSNYHQATEGHQPTEEQLNQALTRWYQNQPTQNS